MTESQSKPVLRVAMIGYAFMGAAHSQAWRTAPRFFDLPMDVRMQVAVGRNAERVQAAAERLGWAESATDWRQVIARDDIDLVDICTPGDSHAEIAIAALEAGKHVLVEKPLANTVEEAEAMAEAARKARAHGVRAMVGFTNRRVPAVALGRRLIEQGRLGTIHHVRARYLQDWIVDPATPLSWRLQKDRAGSGSLGDLGAHCLDTALFWTGDRITEVVSSMKTFVNERPLEGDHVGLTFSSTSHEMGPVTVEDSATFLAHFASGAEGVFEATRFASGRKNALSVEVNGSKGSIYFDYEEMNVLHFNDHFEGADTAGFRRILATDATHPYVSAWWPAGHGLGYEHAFSNQVFDLVTAIAAGQDPTPSFDDGLAVQRILDAVEVSAAQRRWQTI